MFIPSYDSHKVKTMPILYIALFVAALFFGNVNAMSFEMDRGIGFSRGQDIEDWVEAKPMSGTPDRMNAFLERGAVFGGTNLASSIGNSIVIQTQPGSHVILNATQTNLGNQTAEVTLRGASAADRLNNVEMPAEAQADVTPQWNHSAAEN